MSYKKGGIYGLNAAIKAKTICTIEIDNDLHIYSPKFAKIYKKTVIL